MDIEWHYEEFESQMLDYQVGLSTSDQIMGNPDITGFVSTHNQTRYKCFHCGLSQADEVYINIKAINKANLEDYFIFGPVIVDFTPPVCMCDIEMTKSEDIITFEWAKDCCVDTEDSRPLTDYIWAVGK